MANFTWKGGTGQWTDPTQWQGGTAPGSPDTAFFDPAASPYVVTVASPVAIASVELGASDATLDVTVGGALTIGQSFGLFAGTLSVEGTVDGGTLSLDGGTLNLAGGTIADAMIQGAGGTATLGATGTLAGDTIESGTFALSPNGTLTVTNGLDVDGFVTFSLGGSSEAINVGGGLDIASGTGNISLGGGADTLSISGGLIVAAGAAISIDLSGAGDMIDLSGGTTITAGSFAGSVIEISGAGAALNIEDDETLDNVRIDIGSNSPPAVMLTAASGATLTLGPNATIAQFATNATLGGAGTIVNQGTINSSFGEMLAIAPGNFSNAGTILIQGGTIAVNAADFANLSDGTLSGGTFIVDFGATLALGGSNQITTLDANLVLDENGSSVTDDGGLQIEGSLVTIGAAGTLAVLDGRGFAATGAIEDAGMVSLGGGTFSTPSLTIDPGDVFAGNGGISGAITNNGTIEAVGGVLIVGAVTGTGTLAIAPGAELEIAADAEPVSFGGSVGTLRLDNPAGFSGTISGLVYGDTIDLTGTTLVGGPTLVGDTLSVDTTTSGPLSFTVLGMPAGSRFNAASDGFKGTDLTLGSPNFATFLWAANGSGGDWSQGGNWQYGAAPSFSDEAIIAAPAQSTSYDVDISSPVVVADLFVDSLGADLLVGTNFGSTDAGALNVTGALVLGAGSLTVEFEGFLSAGTVTVGGGTLDVEGTLAGATIDVMGGTVSIGGTVTGSVIAENGGTIDFQGAELAGDTVEGTFTLAQNFDTVQVVGGLNVTGTTGSGPGAIALTGEGAQLVIASGALTLGASGSPGTIALTGDSARLELDGTSSLDNAVITLGNDTDAATLLAQDTTGNGAALTLGPGVTITQSGKLAEIEYGQSGGGGGGGIAAVAGSAALIPGGVTNQGVITAGVAGGTFTIDGPFTNAGSITVDNGDTLSINTGFSLGFVNAASGSLVIGGKGAGEVVVAEGWSNAGAVSIESGGTLAFDIGITPSAFAGITNNGGTIALGDGNFGLGVLTNAGTLSIGTGTPLGQIALEPFSVIIGGTIADSGGGLLFVGGALDDVSYLGTITIKSGESLTLEGLPGAQAVDVEAGGTLTLAGTYTTADLAGIANSGNLLLEGDLNNTGSTLTVGALGTGAVTLQGEMTGGTLVDPGQALVFAGANLDNVSDSSTIMLTAGETLGLQDYPSGTSVAIATGATLDLDGASIFSPPASPGASPAPPPPASTAVANVALDGGTLNLSGDFATSALAGIVNNSGALVVAGVIDNTGQTLNVGAGTSLGTVTLSGTIVGGTIADHGGGLVIDFGVLDGVTIAGVSTVGSGEVLVLEDFTAATLVNVETGGTLELGAGPADLPITTAELAGITNSGGTIELEDIGLSPTVVLNNSGATLAVGTGSALGTLTIGFGGTIAGGIIADAGGGLRLQSGTLQNVTYQGALDLTAASAETVTIAGGIAPEGAGGTGAGSIMLGNFSTLAFAGTQTFTGATVNIDGSTTITSVDTNNTGAVLTIDPSVVVNITGSGGVALTTQNNAGLTAKDSIVNQTTIAAGTHFLTIEGNLTNTGALSSGVSGTFGGGLNLIGNLTNSGLLTVTGENSSTLRAQFGSGGSFTNLAAGTLDVAGGVLRIASPPSSDLYTVTNAGVITIGSGGSLDIDNWAGVSNSGTIDVNGGTLFLRDDFVTPSLNGITNNGGVLDVTGVLDNSGATLALGSGTALNNIVLGGTIAGGTISDIADVTFSNGTLDGVSWAGTLTVTGTVNLKDALTGDTASVSNFSALDLFGGGTGVPTITNAGDVELFGNFTTAALGGISDVSAGFETGVLILESKATLDNSGATLSLGSGTRLGSLNLNPGGTIAGGTIADTGGLNLEGGTLAGVTYQGVFALPSGFTATIADSLTVETASGGMPGAMVLGGTLTFVGTQTLDNVTMSFGNANDSPFVPAIIADADSNGAGILTLGAHAAIAMGGAFDEIVSGNGAGDGIVNEGTINAAFANGGFSIIGASFTDFGSITVGNGTSFKLLSNNFTNLAGGTLTGGTYVVGASSTFELRSAETVVTLDADLTLSGPGSVWQNLAQTTLEESLTGVGNAGELRILGGRNYVTPNAVTVAGTLQLGGGTLTPGSLVAAAGGMVEGFGAIAGGVTNAGVINAAGGTLDIENGVSGTGSFAVGTGAELELGGATNGTLSFGNNVGVFKLDNPSNFGGTIAGLIAGDVIDLAGTTLAAAPTLIGNTLTIDTSTGQTLNFAVAGDIAGASFSASPDGSTGVQLVLGAPSGGNPNPAVAKIVTASPVTLTNAHVDQPDGAAISIENAATGTNPGTLDAGIGPVSGNGIFALGSITGLAAGNTDSTDVVVGTTTTAAGKHSGTVILDFSSDGVTLPSQDINVVGSVYRLASGAIGGLATSIVHVGDTSSVALNIANIAVNDGYSEDLTATAGTGGGGLTIGGSTGDIAPGSASNAISVAIPTGTAGMVSGTVSVNLKSDGTPVDGLGLTSLGTQTVGVSATVDNYANPVFNTVPKVGTDSSRLIPVVGSPHTYALNFGIFMPDSPKISIDLDLRNIAGATADLLNGNFAVSATTYEAQDPGSPVTTGVIDNGEVFDQDGFNQFNGLKSPSASLPLELSFDPKGDFGDNALFAETITLRPTGSNASGYDSNAHLSPITLVISGGVENADPAEIALQPKPVVLGNGGLLHLVRPGTLTAGPPAQTMTYPIDVMNSADDPDKDADLIAFPGTADDPAMSLTGSPTSPLAPQATSPAAFNLNFPTPDPTKSKFEAGVVDGEFTVGGASLFKPDLFHTSPYTSPLPYEDDTFQGTVYDFAKPMIYATSSNGHSAFFCIDGNIGQNQLDLGTVDSPVTVTFFASNDAPNTPYSDAFTPTLTDLGGDPNFTFQPNAAQQIAAGMQGVTIGTMTVSKPSGTSSTHTLQLTDLNNSVVPGFTSPLVDPTLTFLAQASPPPPPPPPPPPSPHGPGGGGGGGGGSGGGWGDVHIITYSGLHYDFQAAGEFVLTKATDPSDPFQIQIRLQPWENNNSVSVTTQLATEVGSDRITFDINRAAAGTGFIWDNGAAVTVNAANPTLQLSGGTLNYIGPDNYLIDYNKGETLEVLGGGDYLNYTIGLPAADGPGKNAVTGLDGVNATNPADDLVLGPQGTGAAAGTILAQPVAASELYSQYANSWRVSPTASASPDPSLFDYGAGQTTATFTDTNFPADPLSINQLPAAIISQAQALAAAAGITDPTLLQDAVLDYIETGNINFITGNANLQATGNVTPNPTDANITFSPPAVTVGVNALNTIVTEASGGTTAVEFSVTRTGSTASPLAVGYAVTAPGTGYLGASKLGGTLPSGTVTITAGDSVGLFTINVPQNALGTDPSDLLQVTLSPPAGTTATVPEAQSEIVNNQHVPGPTPPQLALELTSGNATLTQNGTAWTLDFGTLAPGAVPSAEIAVVNNAAASADNLSGAASRDPNSIGTGFANNFGGYDALKPLQIGNAAIVGIAAGAAPGSISETIDFSALDANDSGYSNALAPQTLTVTATVTCFCRGTMILTERGEVPVEALAVGDTVRTVAGALKPIVWIGMGRDLVTGRHSPARPVIVRRGALADDVPHRDLYLTHGHALLFDRVLIPVENLINHRSILWDETARVVEHYHIELEDHDVVLAEGAAAETYYEAGNRALFHNARPESQPGDPKPTFVPVLNGGRVVDAVWAKLNQRAGAVLPQPWTDEPDLHLFAGDARIDPQDINNGVYTFSLARLPAGEVRLRSRTGVPSLLGLTKHDHRTLGVAVKRIELRQGALMRRCLDPRSPALQNGGCYPAEAGYAWTDGDLLLPAWLFDVGGRFELVVHLDRPPMRYAFGGATTAAA